MQELTGFVSRSVKLICKRSMPSYCSIMRGGVGRSAWEKWYRNDNLSSIINHTSLIKSMQKYDSGKESVTNP